MRYIFGFLCVCALGALPLVGCSDNDGPNNDPGPDDIRGDGGSGGSVTQAVEEMLVGRWWLDWDATDALAEETCNRGVGATEDFKVVLDQIDPPTVELTLTLKHGFTSISKWTRTM